MTSSARDIPMTSGRDSLAAVAARSVPVTKNQNHTLPTPPNSLSPSLPPHGMQPHGLRLTKAHLDMVGVESDLDLGHESSGHDGSGLEDHDVRSTSGFDTAGKITSNMLAKFHLPEILLNNGPLPIRHIMGYLHTSVPGFSGIPPTKARRLVVGALEGRGSGGAMGGLNGDVKFEKVGWGRWDAKIKGKSGRRGGHRSPPPSIPCSYSIGVPIVSSGVSFDRTRLNAPDSSWAGDSAAFSHDDDVMMAEDEADKMSLDGSCSSSEAPPEEDVMEDDPDDVTDEEDWCAVGAAALRASSYSRSGPGGAFLNSRVHNGGGPSISTLAKSVPMCTSLQPTNNVRLSAFATASNSQEREAVEALLRLGSV